MEYNQFRPYSVFEAFRLKKFDNTKFVLTQSILAGIRAQIPHMEDVKDLVPKDHFIHHSVADLLKMNFGSLGDLDIPMTMMASERLQNALRDSSCKLTIEETWSEVEEVTNRLHDELEARGSFFYIPSARAQYFDVSEPFGKEVSKKFPRLTEDINEAYKCYACGRYTACVFHLMRIMEHSVSRLAKKLKVTIGLVNSPWQRILNSVSGAIKAMDHKKQATKDLAEIASHLYNVKVAWRNEVMHPKATYTEEEAANLVNQVNIFLKRLASIL